MKWSCYLVQKLRYKYFRFRIDLEAAILQNRLPVTKYSIRNSAIELLDPENGGLAVETALLSCLEADWLRCKYFRFRPGLAAAIFKNRLPVTEDSIRNGAIEFLVTENGG